MSESAAIPRPGWPAQGGVPVDPSGPPVDLAAVREHFPALAREVDGQPVAYLDGPGGTQVPREAIDGIVGYLERSNANTHGAYAASAETDVMLAEVHAAAADFLGAPRPEDVVFGPNMTTLTFALSRAIGRTLRPGDEIVVTRLDHDANVAPWLEVAKDRDATVRWVDVRLDDCTLDLDGLEAALGPRTRLVAVGLASNAVGTFNPIPGIVELAHAAGALTYVDAVHAAPHLPIDVTALGTDFLVCSAYKFFGPHLGVLYGRSELLERLAAYRVRPAGDHLPGKWETGTQNHEALAGLLGTFGYLAWLGRTYGGSGDAEPRREPLRLAMTAIRATERTLAQRLVAGLQAVPGLRIRGITDPARLDERAPTVAFTIAGHHPRAIAEHLGRCAINTWDGDYYAYELVRALGLDASGGMVRVGLAHYNTAVEVDRLIAALHELVG